MRHLPLYSLALLFLLLLPLRLAFAPPGAAPEVPLVSPHQYALCIGINYKATDIPNLDHAEADASTVADTLRRHFRFQPDSMVTPLLGKDATRHNIDSLITFLLARLQPDDTLLIYYSGHGLQHQFAPDDSEGYLVPYDGTLKLPSTHAAYDASLLSMRHLAARIRDAKTGRHIILLLDCCFSGFAATPRALEDDAAAREYKQLMTNPSRLVITAGTEDQQSIEVSTGLGAGHGAFTAGLLAALDKRVTDKSPASATELFLDLRREVITIAKQNQWELSPQLRPLNADKGEIVFLPDTAANWDTAIAKVPPRTTNDEMQTAIANAKSADDQGQDLQRDPAAQQQYQQYNERAATGDTNAMAIMHYYNRYGIGTRKNPAKAFVWANATADTGTPLGNLLLSECFANGLGVPQNPAAATLLQKRAGPAAALSFANLTTRKGKASPADFQNLGMMGFAFSRSDNAPPGPGNTPPRRPVSTLAKALRKPLKHVLEGQSSVKDSLDEIDRSNDWHSLDSHLDDWKDAINELKTAAAGTSSAADVNASAASLLTVITNIRTKELDLLRVGARREFDKAAPAIARLQSLGQSPEPAPDAPKPDTNPVPTN